MIRKKVNIINVDESEHDGVCVVAECEGELKSISKVVESVKVLQQDIKKGHVKWKINQVKNRFTEAMHETVVSELKEELFKAMFKSQEESHESKEKACLGIN